MELDKIILSDRELQALRRVRRRKPVSVRNMEALRRRGLVREERYIPPLRCWICRITDHGKRYLDMQNRIRAEHRWTRMLSIIAIIVSIASLYVSILALQAQVR